MQGMAPVDAFRRAAWEFCQNNKKQETWETKQYIPKFGSKVLAFLHLFSGERRTGDLHSALEGMRAPDGCCLLVVSVDIIFDSAAGDLACRKSQKKWMDFMLSGCIAGIFAGPPCETCSRSRARGGYPGVSLSDGGPRALRHVETPQGLDQLQVKEVKQVVIANRLVCFCISLMVCALVVKRLMLIEHPEEPDQQDQQWIASIWRLYVTRALANHPYIHRAAIFQGHFGARSPKPTSLLVCCGPKVNVDAVLLGARTQQDLPAGLSMGWQKEAREYATASLKTYPAGLCRGFADLAHDGWTNMVVW